jgi:tetratricopeptide (TPR) repeat protein
MAMYIGEGADDNYVRSDEAFRRALELNPDLSIAHNLYTATEIETGRARDAMLRLLARARSSADAELFAGLVQACRFVGLERPAIVAYEHARRLDPKIRTAVSHAYLMSGQYARVIETDVEDPRMMSALALELMGRRDDAVALLRHILGGELPTFHRLVLDGTLAVIERDIPTATRAVEELFDSWGPRDPCAIYYFARTLAAMEHPRALELFRRAVHGGFSAWSFYQRDPWLDPLRPDPAFAALVDEAESRGREAAQAFVAAGGERVLGPAYG